MKILTKGEHKVMDCLWKSDISLTSNEIADHLKNEHFGKPAVFKAIQVLLEEGFIEISGVEQATKIYARKFSPKVTVEGYAAYLLETEGLTIFDVKDLLLAMLDRVENGIIKKSDVKSIEADLEDVIGKFAAKSK